MFENIHKYLQNVSSSAIIFQKFGGVTMDNILFRYEQLDAWDIEISTITVFDREKNNVICEFSNKSTYAYAVNEPDSFTCTITAEERDKIANIAGKSGILEVLEEDVDEPDLMLDGYMNLFVFSDRKRSNEIYTANLWCYRQEDREGPLAKGLIEIFDRVTAILEKNGVHEKYFSLNYFN